MSYLLRTVVFIAEKCIKRYNLLKYLEAFRHLGLQLRRKALSRIGCFCLQSGHSEQLSKSCAASSHNQ